MVVAPVLPYYPQYLSLRRRNSLPPMVSFIILLSSLIRVFFWITHGFDIFLLYQSLLMMTVQFLLLREIVAVHQLGKSYSALEEARDGNDSVSLLRSSWKSQLTLFLTTIQPLESYVRILAMTTIALGFVTLLLKPYPPASISVVYSLWGNLLGSVSLFIEALLAVPQLYSNHVNRSTEGLSYILVSSWLFGDVYKSYYFIITDSPFQFLSCSLFQVTVDLLIIAQIYFLPNSSQSSSIMTTSVGGAVGSSSSGGTNSNSSSGVNGKMENR